jgi:hypothetical protein
MFARENGNCRTNVCQTNGCGILEAGRWGLLIGAGVAPGFFKNRGYTQAVDPYLGITCPVSLGQAVTSLTCDNVYKVLDTPQNVFIQRDCKLPNFGKLFTNGVVHVTGQISYNACDNVQYFVEAVYNRARGNCVTYAPNLSVAPDFCSGINCGSSCNTNCSTGCNTSCSTSCVVSGTPIATFGYNAKIGTYQAYGGYLGARYYCNRVWCDRFSFFGGFKIGMLHRKQVCQAASYPARTATLTNSMTTYTFDASNSSSIIFCASNAISGGVQVGLDYCINDCWSLLVAVEFLTTSPFKVSRNLPITIPDPSNAPVQGFGRNFNYPSNLIVAPLGCLLQIPVWAGIRWEFDWCKDSCNEC